RAPPADPPRAPDPHLAQGRARARPPRPARGRARNAGARRARISGAPPGGHGVRAPRLPRVLRRARARASAPAPPGEPDGPTRHPAGVQGRGAGPPTLALTPGGRPPAPPPPPPRPPLAPPLPAAPGRALEEP